MTESSPAQDIIAYAYQVAKFTNSNGEPGRQLTNWSWHVQEEEPSEDNWEQSDDELHIIRNVISLVPTQNATEAVAYEYKYESYDGSVRTNLGMDDPRSSSKVIDCTLLAPAGDPDVFPQPDTDLKTTFNLSYEHGFTIQATDKDEAVAAAIEQLREFVEHAPDELLKSRISPTPK